MGTVSSTCRLNRFPVTGLGIKHTFIEHIGFTLISLFEGFIIVSGLNSGIPGGLVAVVAILGVLVGRWALGLAQRRIA